MEETEGEGQGQGDGKQTLVSWSQGLQQVGQQRAMHGQEKPPGGKLHPLHGDHHQVRWGELDQVHHFFGCKHFQGVFLNQKQFISSCVLKFYNALTLVLDLNPGKHFLEEVANASNFDW